MSAEELTAEVDGALAAVNDWTERAVTLPDLADLLDVRAALRRLAEAVKDAVAIIDAEAAESLPERGTITAGQWVAERKWSPASTKWDTAALAETVVEKAMESGTDPLDALRSCVAFSYGKVGGCKKLGIEPDHYREVSKDGSWRVIVSPAEQEQAA